MDKYIVVVRYTNEEAWKSNGTYEIVGIAKNEVEIKSYLRDLQRVCAQIKACMPPIGYLNGTQAIRFETQAQAIKYLETR